MHKTSLSVALSVAVASALALATHAPVAQAQEAAAKGEGLEEIVVTARKRSESVQDTPVSMVAFSEETLRESSIDSFKELANAAPNVEMNGGIPNGGGSAVQIYIRGVGQDDYSFPNEPGVGLYIDDVYVARSAGGDFGLLDVERIEVLRGPQGTLYGRNTIGGAVKVITSKPDGTFGGQAGLTFGSYQRTDGYARVKFGITDTVSGSFGAAKRVTRDGLGQNLLGQELGEKDQAQARGALRFQPSDDLDILVSADWMRQRQAGPAGSMVAYVPNGTGDALINPVLGPGTIAEFGLTPPRDQWGAAWVRTLATDGKGVYQSGGGDETRDWADIYGVSVTVDKILNDDFTLKSVTAYRHAKVDIRRDSEHTPFHIVRVDNPEKTSQLTQEFQLNGKAFGGNFNYVVGVFALKEKGESYLYAPLLQGTFDLIGLDLEALINTDYDATSYAVFGEGTYAITDQLGVTVGGRFTKDKKKYIYGLSRPPSGAVPLPPATLKSDWSEFLPKLGLEYRPGEDLLWFANLSRGYKAGGYNSRALSGNAPQAYDPEFITSGEVGFKSSWADNRVNLNVSVFYSKYKDIQLLSVLDLGGGNVETVINNAAKGTIKGAEFELTALPIPELKLGLGLGLLDTKYDEVDADAISAGISEDNEFINAPKVSANVSADYTIALPSAGSVLLHADVVHRAKQYRDASNTPQLRAGAYSIVNARVTWSSADDRWSASVFGTNLGDKLYVANGVAVLGLEYVEAYYNRPREWGVSIDYKFK